MEVSDLEVGIKVTEAGVWLYGLESRVSCINMIDSEGNILYEKINYRSFNFAMGKHDNTGRVFFFS